MVTPRTMPRGGGTSKSFRKGRTVVYSQRPRGGIRRPMKVPTTEALSKRILTPDGMERFCARLLETHPYMQNVNAIDIYSKTPAIQQAINESVRMAILPERGYMKLLNKVFKKKGFLGLGGVLLSDPLAAKKIQYMENRAIELSEASKACTKKLELLSKSRYGDSAKIGFRAVMPARNLPEDELVLHLVTSAFASVSMRWSGGIQLMKSSLSVVNRP
ncbi:MAG TPA: hypothetical protein VJH23_01735 [archaeon]|nr:hypothetical protein [archaeon]